MTREAKRALLENRIKTLEERGKATPNLLASLKRELRGMQYECCILVTSSYSISIAMVRISLYI